ncbi:MAG: biotin--[acetyl-CoA-carboxylase] ligase [Lachnospiraceae bacterium]|nr:biotin--[acetyl-CoA-carboxylase] ligase [Lachnospiraceae bacterium]
MESLTSKVLTFLQENPEGVSGQNICDACGVSRTAIWKVIRRLQEEGYEIEAVRNKGYRLLRAPEILGEEQIRSYLHSKWAGQTIVWEEVTGSTNTDAKALSEKGAADGTLVCAGSQEGGRGRMGRVWQSPPGTTISMTLLLKKEELPAEKASTLTLVMAVAVAKAIAACIPENMQEKLQIKWPNDIVLNGRKICGILTEMTMEEFLIRDIVIGVGINVLQESFPEDIADMASSLYLETGLRISKAKLIALVCEEFEKAYETFVQTMDLSGLKEYYETHMAGIGGKVRVLDPKEPYEGISRGIKESGDLLVEDGDGNIREVYAGEVSVRGLYGYV